MTHLNPPTLLKHYSRFVNDHVVSHSFHAVTCVGWVVPFRSNSQRKYHKTNQHAPCKDFASFPACDKSFNHTSMKRYFSKKMEQLDRTDSYVDSNVVKPNDINKKEFMKYVTIKTIADIPPKYHKKINEHIPKLQKFQLIDKRDMKDITLNDALKLAQELRHDLVLVNETEEGVGLLKIYDYEAEMEKVLMRLQDNEIDAIVRKKINENKGKHRDVLETLNLRIDKSGAEMKANLAKKLFLKGKYVMFDIHVQNQEDIELAMQKLGYVRDFIEREFPDIASVKSNIESFRKRVFVEFAPSEALYRERREAEQARKAAAAEKERNKRRLKQGQQKKPAKRKVEDTGDPYKGKRFRVEDF